MILVIEKLFNEFKETLHIDDIFLLNINQIIIEGHTFKTKLHLLEIDKDKIKGMDLRRVRTNESFFGMYFGNQIFIVKKNKTVKIKKYYDLDM